MGRRFSINTPQSYRDEVLDIVQEGIRREKDKYGVD